MKFETALKHLVDASLQRFFYAQSYDDQERIRTIYEKLVSRGIRHLGEYGCAELAIKLTRLVLNWKVKDLLDTVSKEHKHDALVYIRAQTKGE